MFFVDEPVRQFRQQLLEYGWVDVLAELEQNEPGTDLALVNNNLHYGTGREARVGLHQEHPKVWYGDDEHPIQQVYGADGGYNQEPEPYEHEDFLVDDVQR